MLPAKNRLNLALKKVPGKKYKKVQNENFAVKFARSETDFKAAVTVSKKVAKKAVDRNRIKRITLEATKDLNLKNGEFIISVKKNISALKKEEVKILIKDIINNKIHDAQIN